MAQQRKAKTDVQVKYYEVLTDGILGATVHDAEAAPHQLTVLRGQVTSADLQAVGADIDWLLRTGQIAELGYAPA